MNHIHNGWKNDPIVFLTAIFFFICVCGVLITLHILMRCFLEDTLTNDVTCSYMRNTLQSDLNVYQSIAYFRVYCNSTLVSYSQRVKNDSIVFLTAIFFWCVFSGVLITLHILLRCFLDANLTNNAARSRFLNANEYFRWICLGQLLKELHYLLGLCVWHETVSEYDSELHAMFSGATNSWPHSQPNEECMPHAACSKQTMQTH